MSHGITTVDKTLDVRGTLCPMPVIRSQGAIREIPIGGILEILATDEGSVGDIPAWIRNTGQFLVDHSIESGVFRFVVRREK